MTAEDRARAAERLMDDPLVVEIMDAIEKDAVEAMLRAETDDGRREGRDTVKTIRAMRSALQRIATEHKMQKSRLGIV